MRKKIGSKKLHEYTNIYVPMVQILKEFEGCLIISLGGVAFRRKALGKPLCVCAVIINHVVLLHPFKPVFICRVQLL
jgi:uncharacterized membrane protein YjjP (DUF1212 family)